MEPASNDEWDPRDERNRTGERLVVRTSDPPSEHEERTTLHDELRAPHPAPESDALPTQPDLEAPPAPPGNLAELHLDEPGADSDDFRDTIPAPVPVDES
jgi:hypothetical protein